MILEKQVLLPISLVRVIMLRGKNLQASLAMLKVKFLDSAMACLEGLSGERSSLV